MMAGPFVGGFLGGRLARVLAPGPGAIGRDYRRPDPDVGLCWPYWLTLTWSYR